ncbi:MAG: tyrosine-protein phosphatase [Pediococcus pentosaceus]|jgi:protein-tyrosine phosphatase|nr:tyrosine-protein phosphatase [Pediococcus pentosaceus]
MTSRRILSLSGGFNFRDLGGYPTIGQSTVKWHKLVRSGYLTDLVDEDLKKLIDYGIDIVIDLRSESEVISYPDRLSEEIEYIKLPIFSQDQTESNISLEKIYQLYAKNSDGGFQKIMRSYRKLAIDRHAQRAYRHFFEILLKYGNKKGILFHCSAGKDRTGMCALLLLAALGVRMEDIRKDYMLTNVASVARVEWRISEAKKMQLGSNFISSVRDLATVRNEYFDQLIGILEYQYGGITQYLKTEIGLTDVECKELRKIYLN